jgi:hypothetical protein
MIVGHTVCHTPRCKSRVGRLARELSTDKTARNLPVFVKKNNSPIWDMLSEGFIVFDKGAVYCRG